MFLVRSYIHFTCMRVEKLIFVYSYEGLGDQISKSTAEYQNAAVCVQHWH